MCNIRLDLVISVFPHIKNPPKGSFHTFFFFYFSNICILVDSTFTYVSKSNKSKSKAVKLAESQSLQQMLKIHMIAIKESVTVNELATPADAEQR